MSTTAIMEAPTTLATEPAARQFLSLALSSTLGSLHIQLLTYTLSACVIGV
jgi:hypothetical protein